MILAIDAGNYETKFYDGRQLRAFPSLIGEYRDRNLKQQHGEFDFEWEYDGQRGFAGTLALHESECADSQKGESKAHPDARLRVLLALHQFGDGVEHQIIVGQPISTHQETEKAAIKEMLCGRHEVIVNGKRKVIVIRRCEVAAEGVTAGLLVPGGGLIRVIDVGSGTVNFGTLIDRRFNDRGSFTLGTGMETLRSVKPADFARQIALRALARGWKANDTVYLCGGGAGAVLDALRAYFPGIRMIEGDPEYANVKAFYLIARKVYG
ncbi:ParM/StbA family protein [Paenibacillus sp. FSL W8-1287]|uniref:ParM/StbA family protein n=1 Tax=Paenibacillus sp. FSL W8-1287 TaxID=2954653 RepID=UPI0030D416A3